MAFTVSDVQDLVRLLREHPEWRDEVRREVLGSEYLPLPELARANAEAIAALTTDMRAAQRDTAELRELIRQTTENVNRSSEDIRRVLDEHLPKAWDDLAWLKGESLENRYRARPGNLVQLRLRRPRVIQPLDLLEDALESGTITPDQWKSVSKLDLLIAGREGTGAESRDAMLAIETSWTVDERDVERAAERAGILRQAGHNAYPAVAGERASGAILAYARELGVEIYLDEQLRDIAR